VEKGIVSGCSEVKILSVELTFEGSEVAVIAILI